MNSNESLNDIRGKLEAWYKQRVGLPDARITGFDTPASGVVNETYLHTVTFIQNTKPIALPAVLRIQPATSDTPIPDVDVKEQAFVLRQLSNIEGLKTPKVFWEEQDTRWLGRPFYVMERMPGEAVFDAGTVPNDANALRSMYQQAISVMARIHAVDWKRAGLQPIYRGTRDKTPLRAQISAYRVHFETASGGKHYPLLEAAFDWLNENVPDQTAAVLNWGDARIGNLLFDGSELTAVLDWEIADIAPREVDMGWFIYFERFLRKNGIDNRPGAMSDDEIVTFYEHQSGVELADLEYFQRWAAFRLAVMRLRAGVFAMKRGLEPSTSRIDEVNFASIELARLFGFPEPE